jgi:hypothetical protein
MAISMTQQKTREALFPALIADAQTVNDAWNEHLRTASPLVRRNPITLCEENAS